MSVRWFSKKTDDVQNYIISVPTLDPGEIARRANLTAQAQQLALSNLPNPQSNILSNAESQVIQSIELYRQKRFESLLDELQHIQSDISKLNELPDLQNVWLIETQYDRDATQLVSEQSQLIRSLASNAQKRVRELERFKSQNKIQREAEYPLASGRFLRYCLLIFLIVIEALFNAEFFSEGLSTGLLGGFTYAALLAAVNVLMSFFLGKTLVRLLFHSDPIKKTMGLMSLLLTFTFVFCMALGIAHIRDQLVVESINPARMALTTLTQDPFELGDLFSWLLLAVSISFALGALADGLTIDDLYPGYGAQARKTETALNDYMDELDEVRQDLEEMKSNALAELDRSIEKAQSSIAEYRHLIDRKKQIRLRFDQMIHDSNRVLEALLQIFRTENEIHRTDGQRPDYFNEIPKLKPLEMPWVEHDEQQLILHTRLMQTLTSQSQDIRNKLNETFLRFMDRLTFVPIETLDPLKSNPPSWQD
jgi:hypothetical protein